MLPMDDKPNILIVDDEPFNVDYLEQELEDLGYRTTSAANGQQALDLVQEYPPDMILLDIMMPVMDGFEVLTRLKASESLRDIPVVVISAMSDLESVVKGIDLGADDYLPKPFEPTLLEARLRAGLEKKRLRDIEKVYLEALERELEIGREIQADFLPREIPQFPGWELSSFFRAAREVAGDFYDVFELGNGKLALLLGDVTDKGVGSALFMALFRSLLRSAMMEYSLTRRDEGAPQPEARLEPAVSLVNSYICQVHGSAMFATLFFGVLDIDSGELTYINAGHDYPYLLRRGDVLAQLNTTGPAVGAIDLAGFATRTVRFEPGDALVVYSDGIIDAQDGRGERFEQHRWLALLGESPQGSLKWIDHLTSRVLDFIGEASQYDDISLLTVTRQL
jgi:serine phosphatase RsbU (regulator of sigma subunit)